MTGNKHAFFGAKFLTPIIKIIDDKRVVFRRIFANTFGGATHLWVRE